MVQNMKFTDRYMVKDNTIQATGHTTAFIVKLWLTVQDVFDTLKRVF